MVTTGDRDGTASYLTPLMTNIEGRAEVRFGIEATSLVRDEGGAITAVNATHADGHAITISIGAVVIATGGFGSNYDLMRQYSSFNPLSQSFEGPQQGFAIIAGPKIGAQLVMPGGCTRSYSPADPLLPADNEGRAIMVSLEGVRFVNENLYFSDCGYLGGEQGFSSVYRLYDQALVDSLTDEGLDFSDMENAIAAGTAFRANTIVDLASQIGMNALALSETIERYNRACETGIDEEFGKPATRVGKIFDPNRELSYMPVMIDREYTLLNPISTAPFYALRCDSKAGGPYTITHGGLKINTNGQVLDCFDAEIPGLFAAGESANGQFLGKWYPQSGTSLLICFTMGRFAGSNAAKSVLAL